MSQFDELFKDLSEMEDTPLAELMVETDADSALTNVSLMSEGETVYELHNATNMDRRKSFNTHYEVLYHMRRTKDGKLQTISALHNDFGNLEYRGSSSKVISADLVYQKIQAIYDTIKKEGVLKNFGPDFISSSIWGDDGLAIEYLDPRSDERRFFYDKEKRIKKIIDKRSIKEYRYSQDTGKPINIRAIYFKEGENGLEENHLIEKTFDDGGKLLTCINRTSSTGYPVYNSIRPAEARIETVETNYYDIREEDDKYSYYMKTINRLSHQKPNYTREIIRVDKATGLEVVIDRDDYKICDSRLFAGKCSVVVFSEKEVGSNKLRRYSKIFDNIPRNNIWFLINELQSIYFSEEKNEILNNASMTYGEGMHMKKEHCQYTGFDIHLTFFSQSGSDKGNWELSALSVEYRFDDIEMDMNLTRGLDLILRGSIAIRGKSSKIVQTDLQKYINIFIEDFKKVIFENPADLAALSHLQDYECTEDDIFGIELLAIRLFVDCDFAVDMGPINYEFIINDRIECTRVFTKTREEGEDKISTSITFLETISGTIPQTGDVGYPTQILNLSANTKDILLNMQRKVISDKNYSDILSKYVGKHATEEIEKWEKQLKKLMKQTEESPNGQTTPQKIIPMSRSEKKQS